MLKAVAIDDEPYALEVISKFASGVSFVELLATFTNAFEAIAYLHHNEIDLLFLDIKMPDISGIDLLRGLTIAPMVIFTTAYSEYAVQSFELNTIDYLLKPFSPKRFLKACEKANEQHQFRKKYAVDAQTAQAIFIKSGYESVRVPFDDILFIESISNYVRFILADQSIVSRLTMNEVALLLPETGFIRIHRSYVVAKRFITKIDKKSIWVKENELPIGPAYVGSVKNLL